MKKDFLIENIDPLGQGVSKLNDKIIFIKKTLPGESGISEIIASKKGIEFGKAVEFKSKSPIRINPECSHFNLCHGCDFLHTKYENEVDFKKTNIERSLKFLDCHQMTFHPAKHRFGYRNRIQLHYKKSQKVLGFFGDGHKIIPVPNCLIPNEKIKQKMNELYQNNLWVSYLKNEKDEGHIELYEKNGKVEISINQNYANGGFTQVNQAMNSQLNQFLTEKVQQIIPKNEVIFDLFGGNGNLTKSIENPTLVVDYYPQLPANTFHQVYLHQDLYSEKAIKNIAKFYSRKPSLIIFDPPRSGLKNIGEFLTEFTPKNFIFIACEFSSFTRDIKPILKDYTLDDVHIFDLFPGTHHFETVGIFTKRS